MPYANMNYRCDLVSISFKRFLGSTLDSDFLANDLRLSSKPMNQRSSLYNFLLISIINALDLPSLKLLDESEEKLYGM